MTAAACNRGSSLAVDLGPMATHLEAPSDGLCQVAQADQLEPVPEIVGQPLPALHQGRLCRQAGGDFARSRTSQLGRVGPRAGPAMQFLG